MTRTIGSHPTTVGRLLTEEGILPSSAEVRRLARRRAIRIEGATVREDDTVQTEKTLRIEIGRKHYTLDQSASRLRTHRSPRSTNNRRAGQPPGEDQ